MKPIVYLETTIIGHLAMRVSGVLRVAANQQTTREWWENERQNFDLCVSRFVVDECSDGDRVAAEERLAYLEGIPLLEISEDVSSLADSLVAGVPFAREGNDCRTAHFRCSSERCRIPVDMELQAHRKPFDAAAD